MIWTRNCYRFERGSRSLFHAICSLICLHKVHLWDLSGDQQYYDVRAELYGGTDACFVVFDVTNPSSFENLGTSTVQSTETGFEKLYMYGWKRRDTL